MKILLRQGKTYKTCWADNVLTSNVRYFFKPSLFSWVNYTHDILKY